MKKAFHRPAFAPLIVSMTAALLLQGRQCLAATSAAALPWDQTRITLQDILIAPVAHAAIVLAFLSAGLLYAVGCDKQAGRLAASGISGCVALGAIRLLNFVFPYLYAQ